VKEGKNGKAHRSNSRKNLSRRGLSEGGKAQKAQKKKQNLTEDRKGHKDRPSLRLPFNRSLCDLGDLL
jgi:hypothetical protein